VRWSWVAALALVVLATSGCGSRCAEIAARQRQLLGRRPAAGPHVEVLVPLERANAVIANVLRDEPVEVPIAVPELGPLKLPVSKLTAVARQVRLRPAPAGRVRVAMRVDVRAGRDRLVTLSLRGQVAPRLVRGGGSARVEIALRPRDLIAVRPELDDRDRRRLADAVARLLPRALASRLPRPVLERAAGDLAEYLTGSAYAALRRTLLVRVGELTRIQVRLPELPVADARLRTVREPVEALLVELTTDLPVRRGLRARIDRAAPVDGVARVRLSASAVAEIGNWAIARGHLPGRYSRSLAPRRDGEYRPVFDWRGTSPRPLAVHVFQQRGGCSHFVVGVRPEIGLDGQKLRVTVRDRRIESAAGPPWIELAAWLKQLLSRSVDRSRRIAASTRFTVGGRRFATRVTRASLRGGELTFDLALDLALSHASKPEGLTRAAARE
jgi:hypothetical protein